MVFKKEKIITGIIILITFVIGCQETSPSVEFEEKTLIIAAQEQEISIVVEIADTEIKRAQGLMNRQSLDDNKGMLFVFNEEADHSFWMKNTEISLDIFFINAQREVVYIEENTTPLSLKSISSGQSVLYALELNSGFAEKNNINIGDAVYF